MLADPYLSQEERAPLLAVPYLPQEELLCGGAAAAMVQRYWGAAQDPTRYAHLVDEERRGIATADLVRALRDEGWGAVPFAGTATTVREHLGAGRPVIALIEDRPGWYHYVVVVAWIDGHVVLHDSAVGPYRVHAEPEFERRWAVARRWSLVIVPPQRSEATDAATGVVLEAGVTPELAVPKTHVPPVRAAAAPVRSAAGTDAASDLATPADAARDDTCSGLLAAGVDAARSGDETLAEARFGVAMAACPGSPATPRELARLRFQQRRWADAADLAGRALARDETDPHARRLRASARFLDGDRDGALSDWNAIDEPRVDLVEIQGLTLTRHPVVAGMLTLRPGDLLRRQDLVRARRRLAELPVAQVTALRYEPPREGRARVVAAVVERPVVPKSPLTVGAAALRAAVAGELRVPLADPGGGGAAWSPWWRWGDGRSGGGVSLALPAPAGIGAVWTVDVHRQHEIFAETGPPSGSDAGERDHIGLTIADWARPDVRWQARTGWDRWDTRGHHAFAGIAVEKRLAADRVALRLDGTGWTSVGAERRSFLHVGAALAWRSSADELTASSWHGVFGLRAVGGEAPFDLWPGAGQGELREPLLRAHPLGVDGAIRTTGIGRTLWHGTLEHRRRLVRLGPIGLGAAVFADAARVGDPASTDGGGAAELQLDAGAGLRLRLPGQPGHLRVDVARGLLDGATGFSAGWILDWRD